MPSEDSSVERLRELAEAQGVSPTDEDLAAVLTFLEQVLPAFAEVEALVPPETPL